MRHARRAVVRGTVVDGADLEVRVGLGKYAVEGLFDRGSDVPVGEKYADERGHGSEG
jgi:hypothetical protein